MDPLAMWIIIAAVVLLFVYIFWDMIKKLLVNSLVGIIVMLLLKLVFVIDLPVNVYTVLAAAIFGLPAVGTILILYLGGVI